MFGTPKAPGSGVKNDDLVGHPLLITVHEKKYGITTSAGVADAISADVVELDTGAEHTDVLLFGKVLFGQLDAGTKYVGYISKGVAQPGKSAPWQFTDAPDQYDTAQKYIAHKATQGLPSAPAPAFAGTAPAPAAAPPPWA